MATLNTRDLQIIKYIIETPKPKQATISSLFEIDRGNLSRRCNQFKQMNLLANTTALQFNSDFQHYLIIEIMQNKIRAFITNCYGEITSKEHSMDFLGFNSLQEALISFFKVFDNTSYEAVGCVVHSQIKNNIITHFHNNDIKNFPILSILKSITEKNIYLENFANVAALTHYVYTDSFSHSLFFMRTMPALGAGLVYHQEIFHGFSGCAMEPGWMLFNYDKRSFFNDYFTGVESKLLNETTTDFDTQMYIESLNLIITNISSIVDPEGVIIDCDFIRANPHLLYRLKHENIRLSEIPNNKCYKSICKIILQKETGINYTKVAKLI